MKKITARWLTAKEYPNDSRPRDAIEAAKRWLKNPTKRNSEAASADMPYAASAAHAVDAVYAAARAADAALAVADVYAAARAAAGDAMRIKIIKYGLKLIYKDNK
jgi:hypothetical protein